MAKIKEKIDMPSFVMGSESDYDYLVKMPLTGFDAHVRGLLVKEEDIVRNQTSTPKYIYETICRLIYSCTRFEIPTIEGQSVDEIKRNNPFDTFDHFMKNTPSADRDALLWGIIMKTYDETQDISMECDRCKQRFETKLDIPKMMNIKYYKGKDPIMSKEVILEIPEYDWIIRMRQPSLEDELRILNYNAANSTLTSASEYSMITSLEAKINKMNDTGKETRKEDYIVDTPIEIYSMIAERPAKLRKKIMKAWSENFGNFGVTVEFETVCPQCKNVIKSRLVPMAHLFQQLG